MTKTLTEQWRDGTLPEGDYYIKRENDTIIDFYYCNHWEWIEYEPQIKEVLAPVPSYDEIKRLQEQLTEANKLIKDFHEMHEFNKSVIDYLEKWGVKWF